MRLISYGLNPHLKALGLDIEPSQDIEHIKASEKPFIAWNYHANQELFDHCYSTGREAYVAERGALPGTIFLDGGGFNVLSKSYAESNWNHTISLEKQDATCQYIIDLVKDTTSLEPQSTFRITRSAFDTLVKRDKYRKVVFVPLQLNRDTVIRYFSDWVGSVTSFVDMINRIAEKNPDILFLVKNHPLECHIDKGSGNIFIADGLHYKDCLEHSDIVATINSGVGMQAMAFCKPCLICGDAFYQFQDINHKIHSEKELEEGILRCDPVLTPRYGKVIKFYSWLIHEFYSFVTMIKPNPTLNRMQIKEVKQLRFYKPKEGEV